VPAWYARLEIWFATHRILATLPVAVLLLLLARPSLSLLLSGSALVALGEAGRIWASGYIDKNRELATSGPYAHTRNPLYVANLVLLGGFCVMGGNFYTAGLALLAFAMIYRPVLKEEAAYMESLFGHAYLKWSSEVPLFFPRLTAFQGALSRFSWRLVIQHREHKNALAFLAGAGIFFAIYYWRL